MHICNSNPNPNPNSNPNPNPKPNPNPNGYIGYCKVMPKKCIVHLRYKILALGTEDCVRNSVNCFYRLRFKRYVLNIIPYVFNEDN